MSDENNCKIVRKMVKFILKDYGYQAYDVGNAGKKLRNFSKAEMFKTYAVYGKVGCKSINNEITFDRKFAVKTDWF